MKTEDEQARERALGAQLAQAREKLDVSARELRAIDAELEGMATERQQYRLLDEVCGALEQLGLLGGDRLFWGERAAGGEVAEHVRGVRGRVAAFQKRIGEVEERRQEVFEQIERQQEGAELLEDEIFQAQQELEQRKLEWVIEREVGVFPVAQLVMPWTRGGEEDLRFRKTLATSLLLGLLLALLLPQIELPLQTLGEPLDVPARLTRLIMEPRPLPPPPPREEPPDPLEQAIAEQAPAESKKQGPGKGPGQGPGAGPGKGILAFREKLSGFTQNQALSRLGSQARISAAGAAPSGLVERSMVTTQAPGSSGGINLAELSRNVAGGGGGAGGQIAGVQVARATSTIAGGGGGARGPSAGSGGPGPSRTDEEIQIVFDRHKSALYRLYNRELRVDPTLKGQMVLRIRIEPDGSVSLCELQATDMRAPQLAGQVVDRVKAFDFGAKEGIPAVTILYPIDFLPAA